MAQCLLSLLPFDLSQLDPMKTRLKENSKPPELSASGRTSTRLSPIFRKIADKRY